MEFSSTTVHMHAATLTGEPSVNITTIEGKYTCRLHTCLGFRKALTKFVVHSSCIQSATPAVASCHIADVRC